MVWIVTGWRRGKLDVRALFAGCGGGLWLKWGFCGFSRDGFVPCGSELARDDCLAGEVVFSGVHIHCCGNGRLGFRSYSGSLGRAPSNQGLLPLSFGASPRLGMPSLRSCSVGPPPSAIHGRGRLTRHPCRVAHCAEPPLGLSMGRAPQQRPRRPTGRPVWQMCSTVRAGSAGRPSSSERRPEQARSHRRARARAKT
ncbi:hypothetical protein SAMN05216558_1402 [Pseudomonas vancouverensis]|nr:hypothetical protein SAMN05216558_1402 [Pseudomonas vancouverensis]